MTINNDTGEETIHPFLETGYLPWGRPEKGYTLLLVCDALATPIPSGQWHLGMLTKVPLEEPTDVPCQLSAKYSGTYVPNKYRRLFRDVLTSSSYQMALRLEMADPSLSIRVQVFDAESKEVLMDKRGRKIVDMFSVCLNPPSEAGIIVEATLDDEFMRIPPELQSRRPYYFEAEPQGELPSWTLTILSSEEVKLTHDSVKEKAQVRNIRPSTLASEPLTTCSVYDR